MRRSATVLLGGVVLGIAGCTTGASIPAWLAKAYEGLDEDVETRRIVAAAVLADQVQQLRGLGFSQFHFYTLNQANLTYAACRILGIRPKELRK